MSTAQETVETKGTFVGRSSELAALRRLLVAARSGRGRFVLLAGPAGFGKTRLTEVLAGEAIASGFLTLSGRCSEAGDAPPYWPWIQIVRNITRHLGPALLKGQLGSALSALSQLAPEIQEDLGVDAPTPGGEWVVPRFRTFGAVADLLRVAGGEHGALVVLEDLHWADGATLRLLDHVCAEISSSPVLILATYRSDDPGPQLDKMMDALRRAAGGNEIRLGTLSADEAGEYLERYLGDPNPELSKAVYERTEGHPLFLVEVARMVSDRQNRASSEALASFIPESVRGLLRRRLEQVSPQCRSLLEVASVLGRSISLRRLQAVAALDPPRFLELIDEAKAASLLVPLDGRPEEFRFEHGLVREELYTKLAAARRLKLHRRAAEAIEAELSPESRAAELSYHWLQVSAFGDTDRAEHWTLQAADEAMENLAFEAAIPLYAAVLDLAGRRGAGPEELSAILEALGHAQWRSGELQACVASTGRAADLAEEAGRPDLLAKAALVMHGVGDERIIRSVIALCRRALACLVPGSDELEAALLGRLAMAVSESGDVESGMEISERALELALRFGNPEILAPALEGRQRSLFLPQWSAERLILGDRMLALASLSGRLDLELSGHAWRAAVMFEHGDASGIMTELKELKRVAAASRDALSRFQLLKHEAAWQHIIGRFGEARQSWDSALSLALRIDDRSAVGMYLGFVALLARETGNYDGCREVYERMGVDSSYLPPVMTTLLALLKLDEGAVEQARVDYERLRPLYPVEQGSPGWLITTSFFGELAAAFGDRDVAASVYSTILPYEDHFESCGSGIVFCYAPIAYYLGLLAQSLDKPDEARSHLQNAVEFSARVGSPGIGARSQYALAQVIRGDDPKESSRLAASACATAKVLGMNPLRTRAEALVQELLPAAEATVPLSRRECEVAGLVAQGLSNRLIADALVLSPRTVESHVQSILMKLGFGSRAQIAAWATANGVGRSTA
jgi:DNA-binding CsgD family transcriptional regulator/tetratricopeptide (TPR) repeat protein